MKRGFIITAVIMIMAGLLLFFGLIFISGYDISSFDTSKYETNTYTAEGEFKNIKISSMETDIIFKPADSGELSVVCLERENAKHSIFIENDTLNIIEENNKKWYENFTLFSKTPWATVYLPLGAYNSLFIENSTGDVLIEDAFSFSEIDITLSTGDIKLKKIFADKINLSVSTGDTYLKDIACKSIVTKGSTGDIKLKNVLASDGFKIKRSTGDVQFDNCDAQDISVNTSTGDVTGTLLTEKVFVTKTSTGKVSVPNTLSRGKCEITTSTGDIYIDINKN